MCDPFDPYICSCNPGQGTHPFLHDLTKEHTLVTPFIVLALPLFLGPLDKNVIFMFCHPEGASAIKRKGGRKGAEQLCCSRKQGNTKLVESGDHTLGCHCSRTTLSTKLSIGSNWNKTFHSPPEGKGRTEGMELLCYEQQVAAQVKSSLPRTLSSSGLQLLSHCSQHSVDKTSYLFTHFLVNSVPWVTVSINILIICDPIYPGAQGFPSPFFLPLLLLTLDPFLPIQSMNLYPYLPFIYFSFKC